MEKLGSIVPAFVVRGARRYHRYRRAPVVVRYSVVLASLWSFPYGTFGLPHFSCKNIKSLKLKGANSSVDYIGASEDYRITILLNQFPTA